MLGILPRLNTLCVLYISKPLFSYERLQQYHSGDPDAWKNEPVKKSPLSVSTSHSSYAIAHDKQRWYNIPPDPSTLEQPAESHPSAATDSDSKPLDFDTFVPSHDASLDLPVPPAPSGVPGPNFATQFLPEPQGPMVSADEAFSRALGAMYWGGYWTAMYHVRSRSPIPSNHDR